MKNILLLIPFVLIGIYLSCSTSDSSVCQDSATEFSLNEPFFLCYGSSAHFQDNQSFVIEFKEVYGDSRCASDAICVWEGRFDAGVKLTSGPNQQLDTLSKAGLGAHTAKDSVYFQNYKIQLLSTEPYPTLADGQIPLEEYKIKLVVAND